MLKITILNTHYKKNNTKQPEYEQHKTKHTILKQKHKTKHTKLKHNTNTHKTNTQNETHDTKHTILTTQY